MKVQELLTNIHNKDFDLERDLQVKKYIPMEVKKAIAQSIIYECTSDEDGVNKIDSVQRYLAYVKYMITMHTNLEYTDADYDVLCATEYCGSRLFDRILRCFEDDAKECKRILGFMMEDYKREMSIEASLIKLFNGLNITIGDLADKINQKIDGFDIVSLIPDDVDKEQLSTFLRNYIK